MYRHVAGSRTCVIVTVADATVSVPVRARPVLGATLNATEPAPLPPEPDVTEIHDALLRAVQEQPVCDETAIGDPAPPP